MTTTRTQSIAENRGAEAPSDAPAVHLVTFGCQMNKYDSLLAEGRFRKQGYRVAGDLADADVVVFNTCSVRDHAEERVYSWLGELKREKARRPDLVIGVMGCMAQRAEDDIFRRAGHVDIVCGTRRFQYLPEMVAEVRERRERGGRPADQRLLDVEPATDVAVARGGEPYTGGLSGYLAVMRGCDLSCTYCIVPATRGRVRSRPIADLVEEARWMVDQGARVITLLGQTVNSYGEDLPAPGPGEPRGTGRQGRPSLADLLRALEELDDLVRIRLITLHPAYVTRALAEALRDGSKAERFLPLPAQSGSDRVLRAMKRGYTTDLYRKRLDLLREVVPDLELGSDWIVGFPGETEPEFAASERFLEEIGTVVNYVFKYDPRPDTVAHELVDDVETAVKKERNQRLLRAGERAALTRMQRQLDSVHDVLVEGESDRHPGLLTARTRHGLPVSFRAEGPTGTLGIGDRARIVVREASPYGLAAEHATDPA